MTADGVLKGLFYLVLILNYIVLVSPVFSSRKDAYKEMSTARSWLAPAAAAALFLFVSPNLAIAFGCIFLFLSARFLFVLRYTPLGNKTFDRITLPLRRRLRRSRNKHDKY